MRENEGTREELRAKMQFFFLYKLITLIVGFNLVWELYAKACRRCPKWVVNKKQVFLVFFYSLPRSSFYNCDCC